MPDRHYRPGYPGYGHVLRRMGETAHQSCLLLISQEKPADLVLLEGTHSAVRVLHLTGLEPGACEQLLAEKDLVGTPEERVHLVEAYAGNPLALKVVAETIVDLFAGEIGPFLKQGSVIFGSIGELLAEQVSRLSAVEQTVLRWLAIGHELVIWLKCGQILSGKVGNRRECWESKFRRLLVPRSTWSPSAETGKFGSAIKKLDHDDAKEVCEHVEGDERLRLGKERSVHQSRRAVSFCVGFRPSAFQSSSGLRLVKKRGGRMTQAGMRSRISVAGRWKKPHGERRGLDEELRFP